jgi:hypothetical protein
VTVRIDAIAQSGFRFLVVSGLLTALLVASEVGVLSSALVSFVVGVQFLTGVFFRAAIGEGPRSSTWGDRAVSFAIGVLLTSGVHLLLLDSPVRAVGWLVPLIAFGLVAALRGGPAQSSKAPHSEWLYEVSVILAVTLIVLGRTYRWQLPLGIALFVVLLLIDSWKKIRSSQWGLRVVLPVGIAVLVALLLLGVWHIASRSEYWWTLNSDITFTEAVSQSIARWGFVDHVAALGQSDLGTYHWLPFAWTGLVDVISGADAWWISTRTAHVVFVFGSVAGIWSILRAYLAATRTMTTWATLIASLIGLFVGANFSGMVGAFWVISIIWYWTSVVNHDHGVPHAFVLSLLAVGLLLAKPQFAVPLLGSLILLDGWRAWRASLWRKQDLLRIAGLVCAAVLVTVLQRILAGSNIAASGVIELDLVSVGSFGELGNARNIFALPLAVISLFTTTTLTLALWILARGNRVAAEMWRLAIVVVTLAIGALLVTDAMFNLLGGYLLGLVALFSGLIAGLALPTLARTVRSNSRLAVAIGILLPISFFFVRRWPSLFDPNPTGSVVDMSLRTLAGARWIPVVGLVVLGLLATYGVRLQKIQRLDFLRSGAVLLVLLTLNPIGVASRTLALLRDNVIVDENQPTGVVVWDNNTDELVDFVQGNIPHDAIFASNIFCAYDVETLCGESDWWLSYVDVLQTNHVPERCYNLLIYSNDWSLPGTLERRFLIQGPQMFTGCGKPPDWLTERVMRSEEFGRNPSQDAFDYLCSQGVSWFIADRTFAEVDEWDPYGEIVLEQDRLALIRLSGSRCAL